MNEPKKKILKKIPGKINEWMPEKTLRKFANGIPTKNATEIRKRISGEINEERLQEIQGE